MLTKPSWFDEWTNEDWRDHYKDFTLDDLTDMIRRKFLYRWEPDKWFWKDADKNHPDFEKRLDAERWSAHAASHYSIIVLIRAIRAKEAANA